MSSRLVLRVGPALASAIAFLGREVPAQTTTRVSVDSNGGQGNAESGGYYDHGLSISADGRFIAFESAASNLISGDTNAARDIFVRDRLSGTTERVSISTSGLQANNESWEAAISSDGRFVAFASRATNLVPGFASGNGDVYLRDRLNGTTEVVSIGLGGAQADNWCEYFGVSLSVSSDGRFVAFSSAATNLVPGDTNSTWDMFVRDRQSATTELVSVTTAGAQANAQSGGEGAAMSADGRRIAFESFASNLVSGDTNGRQDVFVRDRLLGTTVRVSVSTAGLEGNDSSKYPTISGDGRFVAFESIATNLVGADGNGAYDIFVRDTQFAITERDSVDALGSESNGPSHSPTMSTDGRYLGFVSWGSNLVYSDSNVVADIFLRDRLTGDVQRASVSTPGQQSNAESRDAAISADGMLLSFWSAANSLVGGDTNQCGDVFVRDWACTGGVSSYCTAKTNSLGCVPSIGSLGIPSQSGSDNFYVTASNVLNNKLGMMLWSLSPASNPFGGGTLCLHSPIVRTPAQVSGGSPTGNDCSGTYAYHFTQGYMIQQLLGANTTVYAQWWSRDPGFPVPTNIGLTNGLSFTICP